jgi:predicted protein tyrosine phosphatase
MPKCINISAREAGKLEKLPDGCFLISVNEEHDGYYHLQFDNEGDRLLRVRFSDVTCDYEFKGKKISSISVNTAHEIINFIEKNHNKNAIVHCAAGISRSSAICMFLHLVHGYELKENFFATSEPNPFVLGRLLIEHKKKQLTNS